jgi:hypothetical protein
MNGKIFKLIGFLSFRKSFKVEHQRRGPEPHSDPAPASQFIFSTSVVADFFLFYIPSSSSGELQKRDEHKQRNLICLAHTP